MLRTDVLNHLIRKRNYKSYLEIGVYNGVNFESINIVNKVCVDPFPLYVNTTHIMTSDNFFKLLKPEEKFDLIFVDGLHLTEQSDLDVKNSLQHLNTGGCVVMHD